MTNVTLNNAPHTLTVNQSDVTSVTLLCQANGRPSPSMRIVRQYDGATLKEVKGGNYVFSDVTSDVSHVITTARCEDTGTYRCVVNNQQGSESEVERAVNLYVNCEFLVHLLKILT